MIIKNASTKAGQNIISRCSCRKGYSLSDVYTNYSFAKRRAYDWCLEKYQETEIHSGFRITGANCMSFSVALEGAKDGEPILRYETKDNSYMVYLER